MQVATIPRLYLTVCRHHTKGSFQVLKASVVFSLQLSLLLAAGSTFASFAGGDGSPADPWRIATPEQLDAIRSDLSAHYVLTANIDLTTATGKPTGAFWNGGRGWQSIGGTLGNSFTGTLDGNGYSISGLYVNRSGQEPAGLFGWISFGAVLNDLALESVTVSGDSLVGALVATNFGGTVQNSHVAGRVTGSDFVGGLVARNLSGQILNSYFDGTVNGDDQVGALVGSNWAEIKNSAATGKVNGRIRGDLVGVSSTQISNSRWGSPIEIVTPPEEPATKPESPAGRAPVADVEPSEPRPHVDSNKAPNKSGTANGSTNNPIPGELVGVGSMPVSNGRSGSPIEIPPTTDGPRSTNPDSAAGESPLERGQSPLPGGGPSESRSPVDEETPADAPFPVEKPFSNRIVLDTGALLNIVPNYLNSSFVPGSAELVTMGVPFAPCLLTGTQRDSLFRLVDETGAEVPVFVKETLTWPAQPPCNVRSTRALKVQFEFDATEGIKSYEWDLSGRALPDKFESSISEILTDDPLKGLLYEPRVFAVHGPEYLVSSQLIPPTSVAGSGVYDTNYYPDKWESDARDFDFTSSEAADWLFDRTSTIYRQAIRRGEVSHYREAYLSHEFYVERIDDTDVPEDAGRPQSGGYSCVGGFAMGGRAANYCDAKYIYSEPIKLHLALTGDDSWQPDANAYANTREAMWRQMADILVSGNNRSHSAGAASPAGFIQPYDEVDDHYNERDTGIGLTTILNACELTLDGEVCSWADRVIDNIHRHQIDNPDGLGIPGYLGHSWKQHEGFSSFGHWVGTLSSIDGETLRVENVIGDASSLRQGDALRVSTMWGRDRFYLASDAIDLGNGMWQITTTSPVTGKIGDRVYTNSTRMRGDRAFSVWMSAQIADAVWQYYNWTTKAEQKAKAEQILRGLAHAVTKYGMWGGDLNTSTAALIEWAFSTPEETIRFYNDPDLSFYGSGDYCGLTAAPYPLHASNSLVNVAGSQANSEWIKNYLNSGSNYTNQHIPDVLFVIVMGILFESNEAKRAAMKALADDMLDWFDRYECTSGNQSKYASGLNDPAQAFSWQSKPDPWGTYEWVVANYPVAAIQPPPVEAQPPAGEHPTPVNGESPGEEPGYYYLEIIGQGEVILDGTTVFDGAGYYTFQMEDGESLVLLATAREGWALSGWGGNAGACGPVIECTVILDPELPVSIVNFVGQPGIPNPENPTVREESPVEEPQVANQSPEVDGDPVTEKAEQSVDNPVSGVVIASRAVIENAGTLIDLNNRGTLVGGTVGGSVKNVEGTLIDINTLDNTVIDGGTLHGTLTGNALVTNAVVDVETLGPGIVLGRGTLLTPTTIENSCGRQLESVFSAPNGNFDLASPIIGSKPGNGRLLTTLLAEKVDDFFADSTTNFTSNASGGSYTVTNNSLGKARVNLKPTGIYISCREDGIGFEPSGEFIISHSGITVTFDSVLHEFGDFVASLGGSYFEGNRGARSILTIEDNSLSFRFGYLSAPRPTMWTVTESGILSTELSDLSLVSLSGGYTLGYHGSTSDPENYRILLSHPLNGMQNMIPYVYDFGVLTSLVESAELNLWIDPLTGIISLFDGAETVSRLVPDYHLRTNGDPNGDARIINTGDLNGDGIDDLLLISGKYEQAIYRLAP